MAAYPVTALRNAYPDAEIVWAVETLCAPVIDRGRLVQRVAKFPRDKWKKARWSPATWRSQIAHYLKLRQLDFDLGIDFQGHSKTALCLRIASPKRRLAVHATDSFARMLNPVATIPETVLHTVDRHMAALQTFGDFDTPARPMMPEPELGDLELPTEPFVSIMTGASSERKRYPVQQWREVASRLMQQGVPVVSVGGPSDPTLDLEGCHELVGKLNLRHSMAVVAHSAAHLAPDTGTGHIASAYGVPVVSIFGQGQQTPDRFRPYGPEVQVLQSGAHPSTVSVESVVEAALRSLRVSSSN